MIFQMCFNINNLLYFDILNDNGINLNMLCIILMPVGRIYEKINNYNNQSYIISYTVLTED